MKRLILALAMLSLFAFSTSPALADHCYYGGGGYHGYGYRGYGYRGYSGYSHYQRRAYYPSYGYNVHAHPPVQRSYHHGYRYPHYSTHFYHPYGGVHYGGYGFSVGIGF